ncbi:MAG: hypothetical protein NUW37_11070 [Planctomycetes bacterium]|nr:hypothetical protein [Planctomycetota bacterium]
MAIRKVLKSSAKHQGFGAFPLILLALTALLTTIACNTGDETKFLDASVVQVDAGAPSFETSSLPIAFKASGTGSAPSYTGVITVLSARFPITATVISGRLPQGLAFYAYSDSLTPTLQEVAANSEGLITFDIYDPDGDGRATFEIGLDTANAAVIADPDVYSFTLRLDEPTTGLSSMREFSITVLSLVPSAPVIAFVTPTNGQAYRGNVRIRYTLTQTSHSGIDNISIRPQWRDVGGAYDLQSPNVDANGWFDMTEAVDVGSQGTTGLNAAPGGGVEHVFVWDTITDFGGCTFGPAASVGTPGTSVVHGYINAGSNIEIRIIAANNGTPPSALNEGLITGAQNFNYAIKPAVSPIGTDSALLISVNNEPVTNGMNADQVVGQPDYVTGYGDSPGTAPKSKLNFPTGIYSDGVRLIIADSQQHRVVIFRNLPTANVVENFDKNVDALVLGQNDFSQTTANRGSNAQLNGRVVAGTSGLSNPNGVYFDGSYLYVADTANNRVMIWDGVPDINGAAAKWALGTNDLQLVGLATSDKGDLNQPYSVVRIGDWVYVCDKGNNRVVGYNIVNIVNADMSTQLPTPIMPDFQIGQDDWGMAAANGGLLSGLSGSVFQDPHQIATDGSRLFVADSANNRLLIWNPAPTSSRSANTVIGQASPSAKENPPVETTANKTGSTGLDTSYYLFQPWGVGSDGTHLAIADTGNHRVMIYAVVPSIDLQPAQNVLGFADMVSAPASPVATGEGDAAAQNNFNTPADVTIYSGTMWVSDSKNNRVLRFSPPSP